MNPILLEGRQAFNGYLPVCRVLQHGCPLSDRGGREEKSYILVATPLFQPEECQDRSDYFLSINTTYNNILKVRREKEKKAKIIKEYRKLWQTFKTIQSFHRIQCYKQMQCKDYWENTWKQMKVKEMDERYKVWMPQNIFKINIYVSLMFRQLVLSYLRWNSSKYW